MQDAYWYPIKVQGGQEEKASKQVRDVFEKKGKESALLDIFVPFHRFFTIKNGKKIIKKRFFAYIVVKLSGEMGQDLRNIFHYVPLFRGFISSMGWGPTHDPTHLEQDELDKMLGDGENVDVFEDDLKKNFQEGERVEIVEGVLKGKIAIVVRVDPHRKKIETTIPIFGKETKTELSFSQVKKI